MQPRCQRIPRTRAYPCSRGHHIRRSNALFFGFATHEAAPLEGAASKKILEPAEGVEPPTHGLQIWTVGALRVRPKKALVTYITCASNTALPASCTYVARIRRQSRHLIKGASITITTSLITSATNNGYVCGRYSQIITNNDIFGKHERHRRESCQKPPPNRCDTSRF